MLVLVVAVLAFFLTPQRRTPAVWAILLGMVLTAAPTLLAFSASYHYFLLSAGWAVLVALWAGRQWRSRPRLVAGTLTGLALLYLAGTWAGNQQIWAAAYAEHSVRDEVLATDPAAYPPGTRLFFLDLPLFATEIGPSLRLHSGRSDLEVFPLTYASEPFASRHRTEVIQEDDHTLLLRRQDKGWFSGIMGEDLQLGWFGASRQRLALGPVPPRLTAGDLPFRVEVVAKGPEGIHALRFVFARPLDDPSYRFFVGSPWRTAQPWHPDGWPPVPRFEPRLAVVHGRMQWVQIALDCVTRLLSRLP
jgi:hypothetical protein